MTNWWRWASSQPIGHCRILWSLASVVSLRTWMRRQMGGCESWRVTLIWQISTGFVSPAGIGIAGQSCSTWLRKAQAMNDRDAEKKRGGAGSIAIRTGFSASVILLRGARCRSCDPCRSGALGNQESSLSPSGTWRSVSGRDPCARVPASRLHGLRMVYGRRAFALEYVGGHRGRYCNTRVSRIAGRDLSVDRQEEEPTPAGSGVVSFGFLLSVGGILAPDATRPAH